MAPKPKHKRTLFLPYLSLSSIAKRDEKEISVVLSDTFTKGGGKNSKVSFLVKEKRKTQSLMYFIVSLKT